MNEKITEQQAIELFNEYLNDHYPMNMGSVKISASKALEQQDVVTYQRLFDEYLDHIGLEYDLSDFCL